MIIKIRQLEETCDELENEVDDLRRKITSLLKQEKKEKDNDEQRHQEEVKSMIDLQVQYQIQLKAMLTNVNH